MVSFPLKSSCVEKSTCDDPWLQNRVQTNLSNRRFPKLKIKVPAHKLSTSLQSLRSIVLPMHTSALCWNRTKSRLCARRSPKQDASPAFGHCWWRGKNVPRANLWLFGHCNQSAGSAFAYRPTDPPCSPVFQLPPPMRPEAPSPNGALLTPSLSRAIPRPEGSVQLSSAQLLPIRLLPAAAPNELQMQDWVCEGTRHRAGGKEQRQLRLLLLSPLLCL